MIHWREVARIMEADAARDAWMDWLAEKELEDVLAEEHRRAYRERLKMADQQPVHYRDDHHDTRLFGP